MDDFLLLGVSKAFLAVSPSTSALKNASTNDQKNQQTPNPKSKSINGANPAKGAITVISNKPMSKSFISGLFMSSFLRLINCSISIRLEIYHLTQEVNYEKERFRVL